MPETTAIGAFGSVVLAGLVSGLGPLATVITILLGAGGLVGVIFSVRYRVVAEVNKATAEAQRENAIAERERAGRFEHELNESHARERELRETVAKFESLPDLSGVLERINTSFEASDRRAADRETRAVDRHQQLTGLFGALGDSLVDLVKEIHNERTEP